MARSFDEWLNEGEDLYRAALEEYRDLESQLSALQIRLATRKVELNKLAEVLNKQPMQNLPDRPVSTHPTLDEAPLEPAPTRTPARNFLGGPLR